MLSAFFSASETAITSANKIRLRAKAEGGSAKAKNALKIIERFDKALSTILIGNNIVNLSTSSVATILALQLLPSNLEKYTPAISVFIISFVVITFGEILPKTIARLHAESFCMSISGVMRLCMFILTPFSSFFLLLQNISARLFSKGGQGVTVTEEELLQIIDDIEDEGVLEEHESSLVRQALIFDETTVGEILTPRVNITAISFNTDKDEIRDIFLSEGYSRVPVYDKSIDHITGILKLKDFIRKYSDSAEFNLRNIIGEALFIPALMKLPDALKLMQKEKSHMAVVVDQYGGTQGLVTLEDILEELVGEIFDEDDEVISQVVFTSENVFEVPGQLGKNDFNRYFEKHGLNFEIKSDSKTVGGWVFELFGKIPEKNDIVKTSDFAITVLSINSRMIERLSFEILKPEDIDRND
jgi:CBS domain containing-hemolysin-like protein